MKVFELVNEARRENGAPPLAWNEDLAMAAQIRAMELDRAFSHSRPDGSSFDTVLGEYGIRATAWGENIAEGHNDAASVMHSWLNSKGHRGNIVDRDFTQMAVGAALSGSNRLHWVQLFIRR
jgi:uncharacterized protein YkwD